MLMPLHILATSLFQSRIVFEQQYYVNNKTIVAEMLPINNKLLK